jgi:hypothetical protein
MSRKMFYKKAVSKRTMNIDNVDKFIIGRWVMKVLHANTSFLMVSFFNHSLNQSSENFEIFILSRQYSFYKLDTRSVFGIL